MSTPQGGIFALGTASHAYLEFDVAAGQNPQDLVPAVASLREPRTTMGGVNLVAGFRPELWRDVVPDDAPAELRSFAEDMVGVDGFVMPATQHDAVLWLSGSAYDVVFDVARNAISELRGLATVAEETSSWPYRHDRDLTGFIDGSENPTLIEAPEIALVPDGSPGAGGTILLLQRWVHDATVWESLTVAEQEQVIGRTKPDSVELDDKPADSHVASTDQDTFGKIFRRNMPYGTVTDHGTMFVGFCSEQRPLTVMLESMAGLTSGVRDALTRYTHPLTGAYYFVPSTEALRGLIAASSRRLALVKEQLLAWYAENGRDLPWRKTRDPYAILVSEVMLQQTQVPRVVPRYLAWLERWPTADALAAAPRAEVIVAWQGLGYNRRAVSLHRAAQVVAARGWPDDLTELPGVGPYTAAAIECFALGRDVVPEDTNVRRVRERSGGSFDGECAQALMDLGADRVPGPRASVRRLPARRGLPVARTPVRTGAQAGPVRGLVPATPVTDAAARRGRTAAARRAGRRGRRIAGRRRPRRGRRRHRVAPGLALQGCVEARLVLASARGAVEARVAREVEGDLLPAAAVADADEVTGDGLRLERQERALRLGPERLCSCRAHLERVVVRDEVLARECAVLACQDNGIGPVAPPEEGHVHG